MPAGVGTIVAENAEERMFDGEDHVFVPGLHADVGFRARLAGRYCRELVYRMTERNFNRLMATAADLVIVEVEEIVPEGAIDPDQVDTPGRSWTTSCRRTPHWPTEGLGVGGGERQKADETRMSMACRVLAESARRATWSTWALVSDLVADPIYAEQRCHLAHRERHVRRWPAPAAGARMESPGQCRQAAGDGVAGRAISTAPRRLA